MSGKNEIKISADFDFSKFSTTARKAIEDAFNQPINARVNFTTPTGQPLNQVVSGIMGNATGGTGIPGGMPGMPSSSPDLTPSGSLSNLANVSKLLTKNLEKLNDQYLKASAALEGATEAQQKSIYATQAKIKSEESRDAAIRDRIDKYLKQESMMGAPSGSLYASAAGLVAGALMMPSNMLSGRAAMGGIEARNATALASTSFGSMLRTDPGYSGSANSIATAKTTGLAIGEVVAAAIGGALLMKGPWGAVIGGASAGINLLTGHAKSLYAGSYESSLESLAAEQGMTPVQYEAARGFSMGPGRSVAGALWRGGNGRELDRMGEASLASLFAPRINIIGKEKGIWTGRSSEDIAGAISGATAFGGRKIGENEAALRKIDTIANFLNLSGTATSAMLNSAAGLSGMGGNASQDLTQIHDILTKAVTDGIKEAPNLNKFLQGVMALSSSTGVMGGMDYSSSIMGKTFGAFGERGSQNLAIAQTVMAAEQGMGRSTGGFMARANWMAAKSVMSGKNSGLLTSGADTNLLSLALASMGPDDISKYITNGVFDEFFVGKNIGEKRSNARSFTGEYRTLQETYRMGQNPISSISSIAGKIAAGAHLGTSDILRQALGYTTGSGMDPQTALATALINNADPTRPGGKGFDPNAIKGYSGTMAATAEQVGYFSNFVGGMTGFLNTLTTHKDVPETLHKLTTELVNLMSKIRNSADIGNAQRNLNNAQKGNIKGSGTGTRKFHPDPTPPRRSLDNM